MKNGKIVTLYKKKGDWSDCNSYQGISLLSIAGKAFANVCLKRLQDGHFKLLKKIECLPKLLAVVRSFHDGMESVAEFSGDISSPFEIKSGIKQVCVLVPSLFGIFFPMLLKVAFPVNDEGCKTPLRITTDDHELETVHRFTYLGSTVTDNFSLDIENNIRIGKAATMTGRLKERVWNNSKLTMNTKVMKRILNIHWKDRTPDSEILAHTKLISVHSMLLQRRLHWLGHVRRMDDEGTSEAFLYRELAVGKSPVGRPRLRFQDVCKRSL
ncbi:uncharacterized protein LOC119580665 [Penaeus monodon]|uniref:uncharacterized protein LOC119580665 n=1 Tax=Penaeus monodon TaxID=6687 RepID=UPI0018A70EB3|nr:uncharacterized protein LOC119580665 [Penaeus monodon]